MPAIVKLSPSRLVLFINDEKDLTLEENIKKLKATLGSALEIDVQQANIFDTFHLAEKVVASIEKEKKAGQTIVINITGGKKILALGVLFGAYARIDLVDRVVYGTEQDKQLYDLPKMNFNVGNTKLKILKELSKDKKSVAEISEKVDITPAMAYVHLRELKGQGYINENYEITMAGNLAML